MKLHSLGISLFALVGAVVTTIVPSRAMAQWPPPENVTVEQIAMQQFWPNDPDYRGQYEHWSWIPAENQALPNFRRDEIMIGAGNNVDRAWGLSIGDPRVLISVLDSGIRWDHHDLQLKAALNVNELPRPQNAQGQTQTDYDTDGDGVVTVADYLNDPRIPCGTSLPHPLRGCRDANNQPNDPNSNGVFDAGDLIRVFSDGVDDDNNGYMDDISGWDFFKDDNDPFDDTDYGHGTGEARDSSSQTNNNISGAGGCPNCRFVPLRVGDSFITDVTDYAQAVIYATDLRYGRDQRCHVVQEALGTLNNSRYAIAAQDYAYRNGLLVVASAADENSRHHNLPGTNNHTMYVHAVRHNRGSREASESFLAFNNCTNYGGQLQLSVAGNACSSEAVGQSSGMAGLLYSYAMQRNLNPPLTAEEARQLFILTTDDINIPESIPTHPMYNNQLYPSLPGWDQRFGYGRTNARRMLEWVRDGKIPPEVDIESPRWFTVLYPDRASDQRLVLRGRIAAQRAPSFDYVVEWARGIEPDNTTWQMVRGENNVTAPVTDRLAELDLTNIQVDNPGEAENRYTITVRIRATAHYGGTVGDVPGEIRRVFYVHRDPDLLPGWPIDNVASGEASYHLADLDGDRRLEVIAADSDGYIHAKRADGTELPGWPVHTNLELGLDATRTPNYRGSAGYNGANRAIDPDRVYEAILAAPAVADIDNDGSLEVVVGSYHGTVYVFRANGTPYGRGFPRRLPDVPSSDTSPTRILDRSIAGAPVLVDLNGDQRMEIVVGAGDGKVYAMDAMTAADHPGFPVLIHFPEPGTEYNRIFGTVGVGRFDTDNIPDLVVVSNESLPGDDNTGAVYVIHGDGNNHAGGPYHPNWPIGWVSVDLLPLVGTGISTSPAIADPDGNGLDDLVMTGNGFPTLLIARGQQDPHSARPTPGEIDSLRFFTTTTRGPLSNSRSTPTSFIVAFSLGAFGDMGNDGHLDYVASGAAFGLALNASGAGRSYFEHLMGAWDTQTGRPLPGFPTVIEDYTFLMNPTIADISGDGYPEALVGTGGYYVRAVDMCGREAPGFPKFTGQWIIPSPTVGDIDGDGSIELVTGTRNGFMYAWRTQGRTDGSMQWPTFRHDNRNTGNYGTALDFGQRQIPGLAPRMCTPPTTDAGTDVVSDSTTTDSVVTDSTVADVAPDANTPGVGGGGCGCRTVASANNSQQHGHALAGLATALMIALGYRRRKTNTHS